MSNFAFIRDQWPALYDACQRAESYAISDPNAAAFNARVAVERVVEYLFFDVFGFDDTYRSDLNARINDPGFKNRTSSISNQLNLIRRRGNDAAHGNRKLTQNEGRNTLRDLFDVVVWTIKHYSRFPEAAPLGSEFDEKMAERRAPLGPAEVRKLAELFQEQKDNAARAIANRDSLLAEKDSALAEKDAALADALAELERLRSETSTDAELKQLRSDIKIAKAADSIADTHDYREDETRAELIDGPLADAGWLLRDQRDREYPVDGMPIIPGKNNSGRGYVDYVLWGANGLPLGIVEAKRTSRDSSLGAPQAKLYADALERQTGQRPVIFLSNGSRHQIWDDAAGYPPREVAGFYTREELELMVQRRSFRKPLTGAPGDHEIAGRVYQQRAIAKVAEHFDAHQRRALLVMATGTGKTRTAVALVKLLMEQGWAKRVLFLADRTALVNQAQKAFSKLLPEAATVNLTSDKNTDGRVYLSTYPTMMNLIDAHRDENGRRFGPGHFDLVIIDEAHRSVYKKYGELFEWFDGLLLGLTATPVDDIARSTYRLFELEPGVPTDSYPLDEAIADGYLVNFEGFSYDEGFHRKGVKYDDLSEEEQEEWDDIDWDEDDPDRSPVEVEAPRVFRSLFNADTVDKALAALMENGLKVAGDDRLGKTIIFAMNQKHATFIKERFDAQYPHLGGDFAQVITSHTHYAQHLIDQFSQGSKPPHIAISVDMLDTGIDVPEVLNLVLFKPVFSKTKFWQMIGRGTRLCPGLLGDSGEPHDDKSEFFVFDFCGNLDYFAVDPADRPTGLQKSLTERLFEVRARLLGRIDATASPVGGAEATRADAASWLQKFVEGIPADSFLARNHRGLIKQYVALDAWQQQMGTATVEDLASALASLPSASATDQEQAKRFDLVVLQHELALLEGDEATARRTRERMQEVATLLLEKLTIPQVADQAALLTEISGEDWWEHVTLGMLEQARKAVRGLVQFLDKKQRKVVLVDWEDELGEARSVDLPLVAVGVDQKRFREKVTAYIREHTDHVAIQRLRRNRPLTQTDLDELERILIEQGSGTPEALTKMSGDRGLGIFIRQLVGLDRAAAEEAFAKRLELGGLNSTQMDFITHIIDELTKRGEMKPGRLFQSPYIDKAALQIERLFPEDQQDVIVDVLNEIEAGAQPAA